MLPASELLAALSQVSPFGDEPVGATLGSGATPGLGLHGPDRLVGASCRGFVDQAEIACKRVLQIGPPFGPQRIERHAARRNLGALLGGVGLACCMGGADVAHDPGM